MANRKHTCSDKNRKAKFTARFAKTTANKLRRAKRAEKKRTSDKTKARATLRALSNAAKGIPRPSTLAKQRAQSRPKPAPQVEPEPSAPAA